MRRRSRTRGRHGDHLVIDDRTGFTIWASEAQKEWNGAVVHRSVWEARHPQDFVRGVRDDMRIDPSRPELAIEDLPRSGPVTASIALDGVAGNYGITISSISGFSVGDWVRVFLDDGNILQARVVSAPIRIDSLVVTVDDLQLLIDSTETLELSLPLPSAASIGNLVIDISNVSSASL